MVHSTHDVAQHRVHARPKRNNTAGVGDMHVTLLGFKCRSTPTVPVSIGLWWTCGDKGLLIGDEANVISLPFFKKSVSPFAFLIRLPFPYLASLVQPTQQCS